MNRCRKIVVVLIGISLVSSCAVTKEQWASSFANSVNKYLINEEARFTTEFRALEKLPIPKNYRATSNDLNDCSSKGAGYALVEACRLSYDANVAIALTDNLVNSNFLAKDGKEVSAKMKYSKDHEMDVEIHVDDIDFQGKAFPNSVSPKTTVTVILKSTDGSYEVIGRGSNSLPFIDVPMNAIEARSMGQIPFKLSLTGGIMNALSDAFPKLQENIDSFSVDKGSANQSPTPQKTTDENVGKSLDDAKGKCAELGFKRGTEKFGECVLKLSE